ncbi:MAG: hypothetical protein EP323_00020 [Gammaproteobacteria bacterium]|nr:MAG: hypothetical protein EP323_00020 [Gammaproteobacteria bacterium]
MKNFSLSQTVKKASLALVLFGFSSSLYAEIIAFKAVGYVESVAPELSGSSIEIGAPIEITYTFDSNVIDSDPKEYLGRYNNAVLGGIFELGDFKFTANSGGIAVINDWAVAGGDGQMIYRDGYFFNSYSISSPQVDELEIHYAGFSFSSTDNTIFESTSLPLEPPLIDFQDPAISNRIEIRWGASHTSPKIMGVLQEIVLVDRMSTVSELLNALIYKVMSYNYQSGNMNSFDSKLQGAASVLEDADKKDYNSAVNKLGSFINEVDSHRGKSLTDQQADELINAALEIIDAINLLDGN